MKRTLIIAAAFCLGLALLVSDAWAHGGQFRGPNGGVPPGIRQPADPEPPPPGPSDPGTPGGPSSGGPDRGPDTPPDGGHDTPGGDAPAPPPITPSGGGKIRPKTPSRLTFGSWRYWWAYNSADILNIKSHVYSKGTVSSSALYFASLQDRKNRTAVQRPTAFAIQQQILPALQRSINRIGEHDDIVGGSIIATGKIGSTSNIAMFQQALHNRFVSDKGRRMKFGYQATESAALALGLLPMLDRGSKATVRKICLDAIVDDSLNRRDRAWAAISLGLQRDKQAVQPLVELLDKRHRYADDNVPAGILVALGLIGDTSVVSDLEEALLAGRLFGRDIKNNMRLRAFAGYAIAKIGDERALPTIIKVLRSRRINRITKRSAAIAAGALAARSEDEEIKADTVAALLKYLRKADPSGANFAVIALSQIGTEKAIRTLMDIAENGRYSQRAFAAIGLATHVWYRDRDAELKRGQPMNRDLRNKIVDKLRRLAKKLKDSDTRAALMLSRGLVKDKTALDELIMVAAKRSAAPVVRGYACIALGLLGDAREDVKDALRLALGERTSMDLRRNAATGLGLLHDAKVVDDLLRELKKARSFAVQGQLITAIGTIGDHRAITPLIELLEDKGQPAQTRAMAAVGLGMIGDLREIPKLAELSKNYNYRASIGDIDELLFIL